MIELMSARQLSERFPLCLEAEDNRIDGWLLLLARWREDKKLKQREHYKQYPQHGKLCYVYVPAQVIRLLCLEATKSERPRPRVSYLYETYYDQFCEILLTRAFTLDAVKIVNSQEETPSV